MISIRGRSRPEADCYVQPNKRAGANRGRLELGSIEFHTLRLAKQETGNRVTFSSIRGRSRSEADRFRNWLPGTDTDHSKRLSCLVFQDRHSIFQGC